MDEKIIHVVSPSMPPFEEFTKEIYSIWETKQLTNSGPKHALFQRKLEEFLPCSLGSFSVRYLDLNIC